MSAEESISDVATAALQLAQHQQLWTEMEARQETYQQALDMGEELQSQSRSNKREVCEWPQRRGVRFSVHLLLQLSWLRRGGNRISRLSSVFELLRFLSNHWMSTREVQCRAGSWSEHRRHEI